MIYRVTTGNGCTAPARRAGYRCATARRSVRSRKVLYGMVEVWLQSAVRVSPCLCSPTNRKADQTVFNQDLRMSRVGSLRMPSCSVEVRKRQIESPWQKHARQNHRNCPGWDVHIATDNDVCRPTSLQDTAQPCCKGDITALAVVTVKSWLQQVQLDSTRTPRHLYATHTAPRKVWLHLEEARRVHHLMQDVMLAAFAIPYSRCIHSACASLLAIDV